LEFHPVEARHVQGGLFIPQGPEPEKLQLTLMRIVGMVGEGNAGSPELLDTHRPDAFRMVDTLTALGKSAASEHRVSRPNLSLRFFRPPLTAKVRVEERTPRHVAAPTVTGRVLESAGPWRSSSDWWNQSFWSRDEWDVALTDGGLYRIWEDTASREWFVEGVYD
jgi:protein ImuB